MNDIVRQSIPDMDSPVPNHMDTPNNHFIIRYRQGDQGMINVIASIHIKKGRVSEFIEIFKSNIPNVLEEKGCLSYAPTIDLATDLPPQEVDPNCVTIIEKWESIEDLMAHLATPHMLSYREKVKDLVDKLSLKILTEA